MLDDPSAPGSSDHEAGRPPLVPDVLAGGGELGARMRAFDWTATPLGPPDLWPRSLKTCVRIMLTSRQPIWIGWGSELTYMYNDPYKAIIGGKHPEALGRPTSVVWGEIWDVISPMLSTALAGEEGTYVEAQLLIMERHGYEEETYYTFSYSPVPDDDGRIGGIICANTDDTRRVIGERQMALLRELGARTADARTVRDACALSAEALVTNPHDLPFALVYLVDPESGRSATLASVAGIERHHPAVPESASLGTSDPWPLGVALRANDLQVVDLDDRFGALPGGAWARPPSKAVVVPIAPSGEMGRSGLLVAGLNPFRLFDDDYRSFLSLVAGQISAAIANAEAYEEERRRAEALAELDRAKTTFFSNVSHEFRTPLTLMLAPVEEILAEEDQLPNGVREELQRVHRNSLRLLRLVNTLLDFSRIEAGRVEAAYVPTDLAAFTADIASTFRSTIERAGLELVVDAAPLPEPVYVDRGMWEKIVLNFLSNAFKYTMEGSITVSITPGDEVVVLEVRDTGTGIPADDLPHVFERFHRVKGAGGRTHEGSGIGLALVDELVRLHGGETAVESTSGRGSTFRVTIPTGSRHLPQDRLASDTDPVPSPDGATPFVQEALRWLPDEEGPARNGDEPMGVEEELPAPETSSHRGAPIVLADDNADMRGYVARLLAQQGYDVAAVGDGRAALDVIRDRRPALILSDVMMPEMDGFELLAAVRQDPDLKSVPVILLSARAGEESRVEGLDAGADDYLIKPFSARELLARVGAQLELSRVRAETRQVVEESEERLRLAMESARLGSWDLDLTTLEAPVRSARHDEIFGYDEPVADWSFERFLAHVHPDDREAVAASFAEALDRAESWDFECRIIRADEAQRWIWARGGVHRDGDGVPVRALGIVSDITDRKRAEEERRRLTSELEVERTRLQEIFRRAPAIIATVRGPDYRFESANPRYLEFVGERDLIGRPVADVLPEVVDQGFIELLDRVRETGEAFVANEMPIVLEPPGGERREAFANFVYQPLFDPDGSVSGIFAHAVEVTDLVNARQEAEEARAEAENANRTKSVFLANMSHELRTPLNAILGYADLLNAGIPGPLNDGQTVQLKRIDLAARHLLQIIEELLSFSRIEAGREEVRLEDADLAELAREACEMIEPLAARKEVDFECRTPGTLPVATDPAKVRQILLNLLSNAIKFTDSGRVWLELTWSDGTVTIEVGDTGIGISAEEQERIFEPFSQVRQGHSHQGGGTGLGLSVTTQLVALLGGTIDVESEVEKGSLFRVRLPLDA